MTKAKMIKAILDNVDIKACRVVRVYGVPFGVGYDLNITVLYKNGQAEIIDAHATNKSWSGIGHMKPNNPDYKYTGRNDIYQNQVINRWENSWGYEGYLNRFSKIELTKIFNKRA